MKIQCLFFAAVFGSIVFNTAQPANQPLTVSMEEAKELVFKALPLKMRRLPKFSLDGGLDSDHPGFYFIAAMWEGFPNGSAVIGHYAVDASTGDVFSATVSCDEMSNHAIRKLQAKIRKRIGLSDAEYHKIKGKGPLCP